MFLKKWKKRGTSMLPIKTINGASGDRVNGDIRAVSDF